MSPKPQYRFVRWSSIRPRMNRIRDFCFGAVSKFVLVISACLEFKVNGLMLTRGFIAGLNSSFSDQL